MSVMNSSHGLFSFRCIVLKTVDTFITFLYALLEEVGKSPLGSSGTDVWGATWRLWVWRTRQSRTFASGGCLGGILAFRFDRCCILIFNSPLSGAGCYLASNTQMVVELHWPWLEYACIGYHHTYYKVFQAEGCLLLLYQFFPLDWISAV